MKSEDKIKELEKEVEDLRQTLKNTAFILSKRLDVLEQEYNLHSNTFNEVSKTLKVFRE